MDGKQVKVALCAAVLAVGGLTASTAVADDDDGATGTRLTGYEEVPAISTAGRGAFKVWINEERDRIRYRLSYHRLSSAAVAAHIHFGQAAVAGGVAAFLCSDDPAAPGGSPVCPDGGKVRGTITPDDVIGPEGQGIAPGEFDELLAAMRAGVTYANVHTTTFPTGEIRGQIGDDHGDDDDDHDDDDD